MIAQIIYHRETENMELHGSDMFSE